MNSPTKQQSLEQLIQEINGAGWQVSTFSQFVDSGIWMASVRDPRDPMSLGIAQSDDPHAALRQAWTTRRVDKPEPRAFTAMVKSATPERVRIAKKP